MSKDEQLQSDIEKGLTKESSADAKAYRAVFSSLKKEQYDLPYGFADRVVRRIEIQQSPSKDHLWLGVGMTFMIFAAIATSFVLGVKFSVGAFKFISGYGGLIIFTFLLIAIVQLVDKRLLKKQGILN